MATDIVNRTLYFFTDIYSTLIEKIIVAFIIILVGFIIGKIIGRMVLRLLQEIGINNYFEKATGVNYNPEKIISQVVTYIIDFFVIVLALDVVAFAQGFVYILSGSVIVIIIIAIILGIKDLIPNISAGLYLFRKQFFKVGDKLQIDGHKGTIVQITLIETVLKKTNKTLLYIPNSALLKQQFEKIKLKSKK